MKNIVGVQCSYYQTGGWIIVAFAHYIDTYSSEYVGKLVAELNQHSFETWN
jgi:hypothetical protein